MRLLRIALMVVPFFLTLGLVIAIGSPVTGPVEKVVLGASIAALVLVASRVQRLGRNASA